MQEKTVVAVDAMGGDNAPEAAVMGAIDAVKSFGIEITLVGRGEEILEVLKKHGIENLPDGMFDRFIGQDLFRGVDEGHINGRRLAAGRKPLLVEPIGLFRTPAHPIAAIGSFVELFRHRNEHLHRHPVVTFGKKQVPERIDKPRLPGSKKPPDCTQGA